MDLVMTAFCVITILFIFFAGCGNTSKEEELLDTLLLVGRNVLQFGRLAAVMRQYVILSVHIRRVCVLVHLAASCDWQHEQLVCTTPLSAAGRGAPWHGMEATLTTGKPCVLRRGAARCFPAHGSYNLSWVYNLTSACVSCM